MFSSVFLRWILVIGHLQLTKLTSSLLNFWPRPIRVRVFILFDYFVSEKMMLPFNCVVNPFIRGNYSTFPFQSLLWSSITLRLCNAWSLQLHLAEYLQKQVSVLCRFYIHSLLFNLLTERQRYLDDVRRCRQWGGGLPLFPSILTALIFEPLQILTKTFCIRCCNNFSVTTVSRDFRIMHDYTGNAFFSENWHQ